MISEEKRKTTRDEFLDFARERFAKKEETSLEAYKTADMFLFGEQLLAFEYGKGWPYLREEDVKYIFSAMENYLAKGLGQYDRSSDYLLLAKICLGDDGISKPTCGPFEYLHDASKGLTYLKKAMDLHDEDALAYYAYLLATGKFVEQDDKKAQELLATTSYRERNYYGLIAETLDKKGDEEGAITYYSLGNDKGDGPCAVLLTGYLLFGKNPNYEKAFSLLKEINTKYQPNDVVPYRLAYCYLKGKGTPKDLEKAKECYARAISNDYPRSYAVDTDYLHIKKALKQ